MSGERAAVARAMTFDARSASLAMLATGLLGIAISSLIAGDFAYQWQPVPAGVPARGLIARVAAVILVAILLALVTRERATALRWLSIYLALWTIGLHGPEVLARPTSIGAWLGIAEIAAPLVAICAFSMRIGDGASIWARAFGLCPLIFGASHFAYPEITASMVPGWIPEPLFWAYFTGLAHLAGGTAIIAGLLRRLPAIALAAMYMSWAVLLHLPRVAATPGNRFEWTMLFIAIVISASAFMVATVLGPKRPTGR